MRDLRVDQAVRGAWAEYLSELRATHEDSYEDIEPQAWQRLQEQLACIHTGQTEPQPTAS